MSPFTPTGFSWSAGAYNRRYDGSGEQGKPGILPIDDAARIRDAYQLVIEEMGFEVALAPEGRQGMEEVFTNLITNAIKYSPADSRISLSATLENDYIGISVSDTGFGIPEEDLEEIFTRFYRVKDSNTRTIHGTGLGLAIVKSIVNSHHGNIKVLSKPGEGTVFTVLLPCNGG